MVFSHIGQVESQIFARIIVVVNYINGLEQSR